MTRTTEGGGEPIDEIVAAGQAAWPRLALAPGAFRRYVSDRLKSPDHASAVLPHAADLFLACACANGVGAAHRELQARYREASDAASRRIDGSRSFADEVWQRLAESLLVAPEGKPPRIAQYEGRAPLGGWLYVVAYREALKVKQRAPMDERRAVEAEEDFLVQAFTIETDPSLHELKREYAGELEKALRAAFRALDREARTLLRWNVIERWSTVRIARELGIDQSNASRRLAAVRKRLLDAATSELRARRGLSPSECASIVNLVQSQVSITLSQVLEEAGPEAESEKREGPEPEGEAGGAS
jgi:RNA polymerase sigma-70 factor (ECF subfamily)